MILLLGKKEKKSKWEILKEAKTYEELLLVEASSLNLIYEAFVVIKEEYFKDNCIINQAEAFDSPLWFEKAFTDKLLGTEGY